MLRVGENNILCDTLTSNNVHSVLYHMTYHLSLQDILLTHQTTALCMYLILISKDLVNSSPIGWLKIWFLTWPHSVSTKIKKRKKYYKICWNDRLNKWCMLFNLTMLSLLLLYRGRWTSCIYQYGRENKSWPISEGVWL